MTFLIGPQRESVKDHFVNQLAKNKETYSGHVSKNSAPGIVVRKGCVVTTAVFIELCAGCGVSKISLGRFGQKTPWKEFESSLDRIGGCSQRISMDVAFTFPVQDNTVFPLFSYASNPSRASLYFHPLGKRIRYQRELNFGMVR